MIRAINYRLSIKEAKEEAEALQRAGGLSSSAEARESLARDYGFGSWRQLRAFLLCVSPAEKEHRDHRDPCFERLACLNYDHNDSPHRRNQAATLHRAHPDFVEQNIYAACCTGAVDVVRHFLDEDPASVDRPGGFFDWPPLLYACYSRLDGAGESTLDVARLLLDRGADPNAYYMWGGQYRFTAVTGAFGEGEDGPRNLPEHDAWEPLARLLLDRGADPNDGQALYNRMFTAGSVCLEMLLAYGLNTEGCCNWLIADEAGYLQSNPEQTLRFQLRWAVGNGHTSRARLLIDHGADLVDRPGETPLYDTAMLTGHPDLAEYLVARGAARTESDPLIRFACACMTGDEASARELLREAPELIRRLQDEHPETLINAASDDRREAVALMAELGADLNRQAHCAPLHEAAWNGHIDMVRLLIERGAAPSVRDCSHGATPLQWAYFHDETAVVDYLSRCDTDIFDAVMGENTERIAVLVAADRSMLEITVGTLREDDEPREDDWQTPLAFAVLRGRPAAARQLLSLGARADSTDPAGRDLRRLAHEAGLSELADLLDKGG